MAYNLIIMIAGCIAYSVGMEMSIKNGFPVKIEVMTRCESEVGGWLELFIFYHCTTALLRLLQVFAI